MDSDEDLDELVAAELMRTCTTMNPSADDDAELDALICETLTGVGATPEAKVAVAPEKTKMDLHPLVPKGNPEIGIGARKGKAMVVEAAPVVKADIAARHNRSSSENSDSSGEELLHAVLAGHGMPPLKGIGGDISHMQELKHFPHHGSATPHRGPETKKSVAIEEKDEEESLLMDALLTLAQPPVQFVSKNQRQNVSTPLQETPKEEASTSDVSSNKYKSNEGRRIGIGDRTFHHATLGTEEVISHPDMNAVSLVTLSTPPEKSTRVEDHTYTKPLSVIQEFDEKQVLNAILNAVRDRQSSVSGDLICEDEEYNVESVLRRAEEIAASSLRGGLGKESQIMHLHEHVELREVLRKARGSVGWPSCVCGRTAAPEDIAVGDSTQTKTSSTPSFLTSSPSKIPTLCIGTTLGVVLLFDGKPKLCGMCGTVEVATVAMRGAVVALSMSFDALTICSGHERGTLILWDTDSLTALREISDEYTTPITRLRHCNRDTFRVTVLSSNGTVKLLSFTRIISKLMYRLTNIAVSVPEAPFNDIDVVFLKGEGIYLIAAVSVDTLLLSALDCGLQGTVKPIMQRTRPPKSAQMQELLQFVPVSVEDRILLCVAWGADVEIFTVSMGGVLTELHRVTTVRLKRPLHAMAPIMGSCLVLMDQNESLHLLDASVGVVVETRALHGVEPVVFSSRSCGMRCNAALAQSGDSAIIIGRRRAFTCTLLPWNIRLDTLVRQKRYIEALELLKAFALEVALAVVGLQSDPASRRASIHAYLVGLIEEYLSNLTCTNLSRDAIVKGIVDIIQFCADMDAMDVFFGPAMALLRRTTASDALALYCLEGCILAGTVTTLPEMYVQPFLNLFAHDDREGLLKTWESVEDSDVHSPLQGTMRAERALMRLEGSSELLLQIAKKYNLVRLAVAVLSYRQFKYVAAFQLSLAWDPSGEVPLYYFECTMRGYTILGDIELSEDHSQTAKEQLWKHVLNVKGDFVRLLHINPERALQVTLLSLQDRSSYSPWENDSLLRQQCVSELFLHLTGVDLSSSHALRPWELARREWPPYNVVHQLFAGLTRVLLTGALELDDMQRFCEHVCSHYIYQFQTAEDELQRQSLQNEAAALLSSSVTKNVDFSFMEDELQHQRMARTLAALYCSQRKYAEAIDCFLDKENNRTDAELAKDVFRVIREEMSFLLHVGEVELSHRLREAVMHRISLLVSVDATLLAEFVLEYLSGDHDEVINILRNSSETFLRYLDELIAKGDPAVGNDVKLQNTYIELLCAHEPERVYLYLSSYDALISYDLHLALNAVKRYKVADAAVFLLEKALMIDEAMKILMDAVANKLRLVRQEVVKKVMSSGEERDIPSAESQRAKLMNGEEEKEEEVEVEGSYSNDMYLWESERSLQQVLDLGISLWTKYNSDCSSRSSENWFTLLELFTRPRILLCDRQQQQQTVALQSVCERVDGFEDDEINASLATDKSLTNIMFPLLSNPLSVRGVAFLEKMIAIYTKYVSQLLTEMIKVLDLSQVIGRIVREHERERFGPFKPVIVDIMSSLSFELEVNRLCKLCIDNDIVVLADQVHRGYKMGVVPISDACYICNGNLIHARSEEIETLIKIYACGHGYHESCVLNISAGTDCVQCQKERAGELPWGPACQHGGDDTVGGNPNNNDEKGRSEGRERRRVLQEDNVLRTIRRLDQTRAKIDDVRSCHDMLRSFLETGHEQTVTLEWPKESIGKNLLAPVPPIPVSIDGFSEETLDFNGPFTAILTDEDVLELFDTSE